MNTLEKIEREEGFVSTVYLCPAGKQTIGYGFNLEAQPMPKEVADLWLRILIDDIRERLSKYDWYNKLNADRKTVIIDMCYQMGMSGVFNFENMIDALEAGNYETAAYEIMDSLYAKRHRNRAKRNSDAMLTGEL